MLTGLKSKLGALPASYAVPFDGGAALAVVMRPGDHAPTAAPRPPASAMTTAAGFGASGGGAAGAAGPTPGTAARAAAAAATAKAAAAVQIERFDTWRRTLMTRIGSAVQIDTTPAAVDSGGGGSPGAVVDAGGPVAVLGSTGIGPAPENDPVMDALGRAGASRRTSGSGRMSGDGATVSQRSLRSSGGGGGSASSGCWQVFRSASGRCSGGGNGGDPPLLLDAAGVATAGPASPTSGDYPELARAPGLTAAATASAVLAGVTSRWRSSSTLSPLAAATVPAAAATSQRPVSSSAAATSSAIRPASGVAAGGGGDGGGGSATHLVVMANGLFGSPSNWSVICEQLREHLDTSTVVLHPSKVNRRTDTYDGIDVCGQRLADEIRSVAAANPSLQRISVIGHSMGGLLLRYAIGTLYNPSTGRVAGLRPSHFITLATPHMGCDAEGLAQVPFIGWVPVKPVQKALQVLSIPTASLVFRRTGRQFFLADGNNNNNNNGITVAASLGGNNSGNGAGLRGLRTSASSPAVATSTSTSAAAAAANGARAGSGGGLVSSSTAARLPPPPPLLYRMTQDEPERGLYFYSALASFASRTAYANTDGDHLVGWANSSLRFMHQLPRLPPDAARARGVVLQDPLMAAFDVRSKPDSEPQRATSRADLPIDLPTGSGPEAQGLSGQGIIAANGGSGAETSSSEASTSVVATAAMAEVMLRRLQRLPWRRIDVSFQGAFFGFAHNNIQVTRRWLNFEGLAVAGHVARQVAALEAEWARMERQQQQVQQEAVVARSLQPQSGLMLQQQEPEQQLLGNQVVRLAATGATGRKDGCGEAPRVEEALLTEGQVAEFMREVRREGEVLQQGEKARGPEDEVALAASLSAAIDGPAGAPSGAAASD